MMRRTLLATAALSLSLAFGGTASAQALDKAKACFIYVGPKNDGGWSQYHHEAVEKMGSKRGKRRRAYLRLR